MWRQWAVPLLLAASMAAAAEPPLVFAFNTAEPFKTLDHHGQPAGAYTEIVRELARRSQLPLEIRQCPLQRCLQLLEIGQADIAIGIKGGGGRDAYLEFLNPPYAPSNGVSFLQRQDDPRLLDDYDDLLSLKVGVVEGVQYFSRFDSDQRLSRDPAPNIDSALRKLQARRFDVLVLGSAQADSELQHHPLGSLLRRAKLQIPPAGGRQIAISRQSPLVQQRKALLSQQLKAMVQDGTISLLLRQQADRD